jgi:hypothetical protein
MSNILVNPEVDFWTGFFIWGFGTMMFGLALWIATSITTAKLSFGGLTLIAVTSSLISLIPYAGQLLCFVFATYLLYRMTDIELRYSVLTVILTRALVLLLLLAVFSYVDRRRQPVKIEEQIEIMKCAPPR